MIDRPTPTTHAEQLVSELDRLTSKARVLADLLRGLDLRQQVFAFGTPAGAVALVDLLLATNEIKAQLEHWTMAARQQVLNSPGGGC